LQVIADVDLFGLQVHIKKNLLGYVVALLKKGAGSEEFSLHEKIGLIACRCCNKLDHRALDSVSVKRTIVVASYRKSERRFT
jgi:hypothetical protein